MAEKKGTIEDLRDADRLIAEKQAQLEKLEAAIKEKEARAAGGVVVDGAPFRGNGYKFRVGPRDPKWAATLRPEDIEACDESEAMRWYAATHQDPERPGRALDTVKVALQVEIIGGAEKRAEALREAHKEATLRAKFAKTGQLTDEETRWMEERGVTLL
jgi:hypothetical protein